MIVTKNQILDNNALMIINPIFLILFFCISFFIFILLNIISKIKLKEKLNIKNIFSFRKNYEYIKIYFPNHVTIFLLILLSILLSIFCFKIIENEIVNYIIENGDIKQEIKEETYDLLPIHDDKDKEIYIHKIIQANSSHRNELAVFSSIYNNKIQNISPYDDLPNVVLIEETTNPELIHKVKIKTINNYLYLNTKIYTKILLFPFLNESNKKIKTDDLENDYRSYIFYLRDYSELYISDINEN